MMCYTPEKKDFSTITLNSTGEFQVITKAGETRYYGLRTIDRVNDSTGVNTAVWMLDRVVDQWGISSTSTTTTIMRRFMERSNAFGDSVYLGLEDGLYGVSLDYLAVMPNQRLLTRTFASVTFQYELGPGHPVDAFYTLKIPQEPAPDIDQHATGHLHAHITTPGRS